MAWYDLNREQLAALRAAGYTPGSVGTIGATGPKGDTGNTGPQGPQGEPGTGIDPASDQNITGEWAFTGTTPPGAASLLQPGLNNFTGDPEPDGDILWAAVTPGSAGNLIQIVVQFTPPNNVDGDQPPQAPFGVVTASVLVDTPASPMTSIWICPNVPDEFSDTNVLPTANEVIAAVAASPSVSALVTPVLGQGADGTGHASGVFVSLEGGEDTQQFRMVEGVVISPTTIAPVEQNQTPLRLVVAPGSTHGTAVLNIPYYDGEPYRSSGYGISHLDSDGGGALAGEKISWSEGGSLDINTADSFAFRLKLAGLTQLIAGSAFSSLDVSGESVAKRMLTLSQYTDQSADVITSIDGNDGSTERFRLRPDGAIITMGTEPADADLANGQCALWFDPTPGAAKVNFKAKDSDGGVVTFQLAPNA